MPTALSSTDNQRGNDREKLRKMTNFSMHTYENLPPPKNRDRVNQPVNTTDSSMESDCHGRPEPYCENPKRRNRTEGEDGGEKTWLLQSNSGGQNTILDSRPRHGTWSDHHSADKRTSLSIRSRCSHSGESVCVCVDGGGGGGCWS